MKTTRILVTLAVAISLVGSTSAELPEDWYEVDFGTQWSEPGSASYDEATARQPTDMWTIKSPVLRGPILGGGSACHLVYKHLNGDGRITARIKMHDGDGTAYVTIRESLSSGGASASMLIIPVSLRFGKLFSYYDPHGEPGDGGAVAIGPTIDSLPYWIRVERRRDTLKGYISADGDNWTEEGSAQIPIMSQDTYIGMAVSDNGNSPGATIAKFDNVTVEGTGEPPPVSGPDSDWRILGTNMHSIPTGNVGIGTQNPRAKLDVVGKIRISNSSGDTVIELGEGLDYAEGFDVSGEKEIKSGNVLIIDPTNAGKLTLSHCTYDKKVAGIIAGARGKGSGVRLGAGQFDYDVALAGRVYCNVDATTVAVEPGDLLTTSETPGCAMKAVDYERARGAILGKAMEKLEKGKKGQILVLVTLQ